MESSQMQRLRLEHAALNEEMKARLAREALAQFDDRRRLLGQEELAAAKRKIQELEAHVHLPPSKKQTVRLSGRDRLLSAFGFTGSPDPAKAKQPLLLRCSENGCDRLFETTHQRGNHLRTHRRLPAGEEQHFD